MRKYLPNTKKDKQKRFVTYIKNKKQSRKQDDSVNLGILITTINVNELNNPIKIDN